MNSPRLFNRSMRTKVVMLSVTKTKRCEEFVVRPLGGSEERIKCRNRCLV
jgi:hypothetical protein